MRSLPLRARLGARGTAVVAATATMALAVGFGLATPGAGDASTEPVHEHGHAWAQFFVSGLEAEHHDSIGEMAESSDTVVAGHFSPQGKVRVFQGDAPEDVVTYVTGALTVTEAVSGPHRAGDKIAVEFMAPPEAAEGMPTSPVVLFLREKSASPQVYRPVTLAGVWSDSDSSDVDAPIASSESGETPFKDEVQEEDLDSLTDLVDYAEDHV